MRIVVVLALISAPAFADVSEVVTQQILPGYEHLTRATETLAKTAQKDCSPDAVKPAFHAAYDAWISVSHIQLGPIEDQALGLAMAFWPDPRDRVGKALSRLIGVQDPIIMDPTAFKNVSAAAQGFTALERVLYSDPPDADYACALTQAITTGLAEKSADMNSAWPDFASLMMSAGEADNTRFQSNAEARRALYTSLSTGLEFLHDQRLGRPLGTFDRPRPKRAEARRSARSARHIHLSLTALERLAQHLTSNNIPKTRAAFEDAKRRAKALSDPTLANVTDPAFRFRLEVLQQTVRKIQISIVAEIGIPLGVTAGFNSLDGD